MDAIVSPLEYSNLYHNGIDVEAAVVTVSSLLVGLPPIFFLPLAFKVEEEEGGVVR